jgi:LmbE family N-acetylglucosaminyl deacetylase
MRTIFARLARCFTRIRVRRIVVAWGLTVGLLLGGQGLRAQTLLRAITDNIAYDTGSLVRVKVQFVQTDLFEYGPVEVVATARYDGEKTPLFEPIKLTQMRINPGPAQITEYFDLWKIPADAKTGRYDVDITVRDPASGHPLLIVPAAGTFEVYRKVVRIEGIELNSTFLTSGDPVSCRVKLRNLTDQPLDGLRVEFSDRYWPWIAGPAAAAAASVVPLSKSLDLPAGGEKELQAEKVATAPDVQRPSTHQYGVVVWDKDRKTVLDIAFSKLVFVNPPGVETPRIYPGQYIYPTLDAVNTTAYRNFYPLGHDSAIEFDTSHTMFATNSHSSIEFTVQNLTSKAWHNVSISVSFTGRGDFYLGGHNVASSVNLEPLGRTERDKAEFIFPDPGLYFVTVSVTDSSGNLLASGTLSVGVNALPKSIMIFCAHEDDEGAYSGLVRAAIENNIPVHYVYFTSGDAGSCDRYYERSCGPAEAENFGALRMDETRASLGHLGVSSQDILFLGLPDGGSGQIWYGHPSASQPFWDPLLATDRAPYQGVAEPNLPYARDSVVEAAKKLIMKYQPEVIATAHPPSVGHIDHIVNNYFVVKALQELLREGALKTKPTVLVDRVYDPKNQPKTPYQYREEDFYVSREAMALAQESWWYYQSQGGNKAEGNLRPFDKLQDKEEFRQILDWDQHAGWNDKPVTGPAADR